MSGSIISRFKQVPITLFRIQSRLEVSLRDHATQMAAGRTSYDLKIGADGFVHPAQGDTFTGPNGMSLRPDTETMLLIAKKYKGNATVFRLQEGLTLPEGLIILHEHSDHYSLQTDRPILLETLNEKMTSLLNECPTQTLPQFIAQLEDYDDQDN
jgi:hypothetical protein